jgi:hypothetical protein
MHKRHGWCVREMYASANLKERKDGSWMKGGYEFSCSFLLFLFFTFEGGRGTWVYLFIYLFIIHFYF